MRRSKKLEEIQARLPAGNALTLRRVGPDDEEFLVALYASTREEELAQVEWAEGQKDQFLRWQYGLQRSEYQTRFPDADYYIVLMDNQAAGRIWIGRDHQQIRLLDIALLPGFQNRGIGTILIRRLIDEASQTNKFLRHMVFVLNNDAHRFYEKLGFAVIEDLGAYKHMEWRPEGSSD